MTCDRSNGSSYPDKGGSPSSSSDLLSGTVLLGAFAKRSLHKLKKGVLATVATERGELSRSREQAELLFGQAMDHMDETINELVERLSDPEKESIGDVFQNGFDRKDPALALVLKLVQLASNLRAGKLLIDQGHVYELGTIRRLAYETVEDVMFLLAQDKVPGQEHLHPRFLNTFYAIDQKAGPYLRRDDIRDFLKKLEKEKNDVPAKGRPTWKNIFGRIYASNSEYVHGRARRIMRLFDVEELRFRTAGVDDEDHRAKELRSFWLVSFVAMYCFAAVRAGFRSEDWRSDIWQFADRFYEAADLRTMSVEA